MSSDPNPASVQSLDASLADPQTVLQYESEIIVGRRAFSTAQKSYRLFTTASLSFTTVSTHWHGTELDIHEGCFAVVQSGARLSDLVGEIVRVTVARRNVFVYVVGETAGIDVEISLARRAFMAVGMLAQRPAGIESAVSVMI